jgi:hypothetical protein
MFVSIYRNYVLAAGGVACLAVLAVFCVGGPTQAKAGVMANLDQGSARQQFARLPIMFERNDGQTDAAVKFIARGAGYGLFLTPTEAVFSLRPAASPEGVETLGTGAESKSGKQALTVLRMSLHGADRRPIIEGRDLQEGKSHYFQGSDTGQWRNDVPQYAKVQYEDVYPGVDLVYYGNQHQLEYDFVVAPGSDPKQVAIDFSGMQSLHLNDRGDLVLETESGDITQHRPIIYQTIAGERRSVEGRYRLLAHNRVGFEIGRYDARETLVIDPVLAYSSYLGGSGADVAASMAIDEAGNVYVAGNTVSIDFPSSGGVQTSHRGGDSDAFIAKFNAHQDKLIYATYLGGNGDDPAIALAVGTDGSAYVTGHTTSTDFPIKSALRSTHAADAGLQDGFVTKLNASGGSIVYSTYLGGSGSDYAMAIALGADGSTYVAGSTDSSNFPIASALQPTLKGTDGFISKLSPAGTALAFSTYIGGTDFDSIHGIALDASGNVYVTGWTQSLDFPTKWAEQPYSGGGSDAFMAKIGSAGSSLLYGSYLGGSGNDMAYDIAVGSASYVYIGGRTRALAGASNNFPVRNAAQPVSGGGGDGFVSLFDSTRTNGSLVFSTYLGGSGDEEVKELALFSAGSVFATGFTSSTNFPVASAVQASSGGGIDAFVSRYAGSGAMLWSTYLGGAGDDYGYAIATYGSGNIYVAGHTTSTNLPTVMPLRAAAAGGGDAFLVRLGVRGYASYNAHDFNGDTVADVLWRNSSTGSNTIWKSANAATQQAVSGLGAQGWKVAGIGDFDFDYRADILWRNELSGANAIWRSGNALTQQPISSVASLGWKVAGVGDFNGDQRSDILWRNGSTGANTIWLSGNSATQQAVVGVSLAWQVAGIGDFDGDYYSDILWRNGGTGANVIWRSGKNATQQPVTGITDLAWQIVGIGDFYGDGKSDILWRHSGTGVNAIWRSGNYATQQPITSVGNLAWRVAAVGDYNNDGRSDILWRNGSTGANTIWRSGNAAQQQAMTGVSNLAWSIVP